MTEQTKMQRLMDEMGLLVVHLNILLDQPEVKHDSNLGYIFYGIGKCEAYVDHLELQSTHDCLVRLHSAVSTYISMKCDSTYKTLREVRVLLLAALDDLRDPESYENMISMGNYQEEIA